MSRSGPHDGLKTRLARTVASPGRVHRLVGLDQLLRGAVLLEDAGGPGPVVDRHRRLDAGDAVGMGEARRPVEMAELHHGHVGVLVDYAVGLAGRGIALDHDGLGRVGCVAADPGGVERG